MLKNGQTYFKNLAVFTLILSTFMTHFNPKISKKGGECSIEMSWAITI